MTVKELSQLYYLEKMIEREEEKLEELEASVRLRSPGYSGMPHAPGAQDRIGEIVPKIADKRTEIMEKKARYEAVRDELSAYIEGVEDAQVRLILLMRFVDLKRWNEIADAIGGNNTEDSVKKQCYRYLKRQNEK